MTLSFTRSAAIAAIATGAMTGAASAQPDLIPVPDRVTVLQQPSCVEDDALIVLQVSVENIGDEAAKFPFLTTQALRPVVMAAAEGAPYTSAIARSRNNIDPQEIATFTVEVGKGDVKSDRIGVPATDGVAPFAPRNASEQNTLPRALRVRIQEELIEGDFLDGRADGSLGSGSRAAIEAFQRSRGEAATGVLTVAQTDALLSGGPSRRSYFAAEREFYVWVIIDPESRIDEGDETNNGWRAGPFTLSGC